MNVFSFRRFLFQSTRMLVLGLLSAAGLQAGPGLSPLSDVALDEDSGPYEAALILDPGDSPGSTYHFLATSDNLALLPAGSLVVTGGGTNRTLRLSPAPDASGGALVTVIARTTDDGVRLTNQFRLTVRPVADPLIIEPIPNVVVTEGLPEARIPIRVQDPDSPRPAQNTATVTAAVPAPGQPFSTSILSGQTNRILVLRNFRLANSVTSTRVVVTLTAKSGERQTSRSFFVTVQARDFQPSGQAGVEVP